MLIKTDHKFISSNHNGNAVVSVLVIGVVLNLVIASYMISSKDNTNKSQMRKSISNLLNIAEAGKEHLYGQVRGGAFKPVENTRKILCSNKKFENGSFSVSCSTNNSIDTIWVNSIAAFQNQTTEIRSVARLSSQVSIPFPPVRGALTARSRITIKGNIEIDGRDYDQANNLIDSGTLGVSTCDSLFLEGSATVGGNGIVPEPKATFEAIRASVSQEGASAESFFASPEAFLGLPEGSLNEYISTTMATPFHGLIYLTQDYVGPVHFDSSTGILIVHNKLKTAELQITDGVFKGLIITDKMAKISGNAVILGAVVTLCEGEVSTFGTGTVLIRYSSQILSDLANYCKNLKKKVSQVAWEQVN
ncbi:MAG TPA: hypothetical protein VHP36_08650 [Chitinispirillaceae bacterium]|nr:hypothetical protein [Chitinispirillaceae bacterium]